MQNLGDKYSHKWTDRSSRGEYTVEHVDPEGTAHHEVHSETHTH